MASKRIDELTTRTVVNTDLLPPTPSGGPSGSATVAAVVRAGLQQPNSASAGAGADITILAADGVTSGAGGNIILEPGAQATTGGNGAVILRRPSATSTTLSCLRINMESDTSAVVKVGDTDNFGQIKFTRSGGTYADYTPIIINFGYGSTFNTNSYITLENIKCIQTGTYYSHIGSIHGERGFFLSNINSLFFSADSSLFPEIRLVRQSVSVLGVNSYPSGGASFAFASSISNITSNQNNYVLTGSAFQRLNCTTASDITGIAPPSGGAHVDGRMIRVFNVGTANLTLKHNSTSSSAANRMYAASGSDIVLATNDYAECVYDSTDNGSGAAGWRIA